MMTLKEAIKHCKDVALSCTNKECALEHFQLLKWLQEYSNMLEKQGEQKITDKVESKFKVGDWAVTNYGKVSQVVSVDKDSDGYTLDDGVYFSGSWCDMYHLWTIQDAKDGDVLYFNDGHGNDNIELIKSITDKKIEFWFCLTNSNRYEVFDGITLYTNLVSRKDATPATQKQRDLLFSKMKEAGYEWDAKKKELKKIEQKPAWSEDDETMTTNIIIMLKEGASLHFNKKDIAKAVDWLRTLKDRIFPQPKQEWSEEDERTYKSVLYAFEHNYPLNNEQQKFVKSLKERYTWKPSDEQMEALWNVYQGGKEQAELATLYTDLKKLRNE